MDNPGSVSVMAVYVLDDFREAEYPPGRTPPQRCHLLRNVGRSSSVLTTLLNIQGGAPHLDFGGQNKIVIAIHHALASRYVQVGLGCSRFPSRAGFQTDSRGTSY